MSATSTAALPMERLRSDGGRASSSPLIAADCVEQGLRPRRRPSELEHLVRRRVTHVLRLTTVAHTQLLEGAERSLVVGRRQRYQSTESGSSEAIHRDQARRLGRDALVPVRRVDDEPEFGLTRQDALPTRAHRVELHTPLALIALS